MTEQPNDERAHEAARLATLDRECAVIAEQIARVGSDRDGAWNENPDAIAILQAYGRERTRQALERAARLEKALRGVADASLCFCGRQGERTGHSASCEFARKVLSDRESVASEEKEE